MEKIMSNKGNDNKKELQISSSAAEYLTFIAAKGNDEEAIEMRYEKEKHSLYQTIQDWNQHLIPKMESSSLSQ